MCSAPIDGRRAVPRRVGRAPVRGVTRCLPLLLTLFALSGCSTLFDAPSFENMASQQADEVLKDVVREQATEMARQGMERVGQLAEDGKQALQRVIVFPYPDGAVGISERSWPVMRVEKAAQAQPQLVLESPMRGLVFLDEREIGLVQDGSVRIVTLTAGDHQIRIEHPQMPPMVAQFYIDNGERITLRWESR